MDGRCFVSVCWVLVFTVTKVFSFLYLRAKSIARFEVQDRTANCLLLYYILQLQTYEISQFKFKIQTCQLVPGHSAIIRGKAYAVVVEKTDTAARL